MKKICLNGKEYVIKNVMEHYEAFLDGKFVCSGDSVKEVEEILKNESND